MKNFKNKIVVITGAGSGMGRAYALAFAKKGAILALNDFNSVSLEETKQLASQLCEHDIYTQAFNVGDKESMYRFAEEVKNRLGNAHVIINNAGIEGENMPAFVVNLASYEHVMAVNFWGVVYGTKAFLPQLVENNEGAVVNISSTFGLVGSPNSTEYCASKFAVRGFTEALMAEFRGSPIGIHCVHPGGVNTNIIKEGNENFSAFLKTKPEDVVEVVIKAIEKKKSRVVFGHSAFKVYMGTKLVPLNVLQAVMCKKLKPMIDLSAYPLFNRYF